MRRIPFALPSLLVLAGCAVEDPDPSEPPEPSPSAACDAEPVVHTTAAGVEFVRTPDACFEDLPDWPYEARHVEIDGLRQGYAEDGPTDGPVVLLLHGQPSWSYLYRDVIPPLADAGYRVIAMDHLGMGRSDKPVDLDAYSYVGHGDRLQAFVEQLDLQDIHLFVQDWGSLIGLRVAGLDPDRYAAIAVGNGMLPVLPAGVQPIEEPADPHTPVDLPSPFAAYPAQQVPFYDGCEPLFDEGAFSFQDWVDYSMTAADFRPSEVLEALTWFDLPDAVEAAYDAPFPRREYMGGPRTFPSLINEVGGTTEEAWDALGQFERPFITLWAENDPGSLGSCAAQQALVDHVPGAEGIPHDRLAEASHFLQDDQGEEIGRRLAALFELAPLRRGSRYCEVLLVDLVGGAPEAEVWGTPGLNYCPEEAFATLDADAIAADSGALAAIINGPRHWLASGTSGSLAADERQTFGALEMRLLATVPLDPSTLGGAEREPYTEQAVLRDTTYRFAAGSDIYELTAPDGASYVMQSMSLEIESSLTLEDLPTLDGALTLPDGWTYTTTLLTEELVLSSGGEAVVLQDDLQNTYQRR